MAFCIISISRGKSEGRPEGAKRLAAGDEPREFTSRGEGGRVPPFFEKLPGFFLKVSKNQKNQNKLVSSSNRTEKLRDGRDLLLPRLMSGEIAV